MLQLELTNLVSRFLHVQEKVPAYRIAAQLGVRQYGGN